MEDSIWVPVERAPMKILRESRHGPRARHGLRQRVCVTDGLDAVKQSQELLRANADLGQGGRPVLVRLGLLLAHVCGE